jgi:hypothetical protein
MSAQKQQAAAAAAGGGMSMLQQQQLQHSSLGIKPDAAGGGLKPDPSGLIKFEGFKEEPRGFKEVCCFQRH